MSFLASLFEISRLAGAVRHLIRRMAYPLGQHDAHLVPQLIAVRAIKPRAIKSERMPDSTADFKRIFEEAWAWNKEPLALNCAMASNRFCLSSCPCNLRTLLCACLQHSKTDSGLVPWTFAWACAWQTAKSLRPPRPNQPRWLPLERKASPPRPPPLRRRR